MKSLKLKMLFFCFAVILLGTVGLSPLEAITLISKSANTDVTIGYSGQLEYENPLAGGETVGGYIMLEWLDADFNTPPPWYDDFLVNDANTIDGDYGQIWMRNAGHKIWTSSTIASTTVSIHMVGDDNDGLTEIFVDTNWVATLDMVSPPGSGVVLIIVKKLPNTTHLIEIFDNGAGAGVGDDVATLGAAALGAQEPIPTVSQWGLIIMALLMLAVGTVMIRRRLRPVRA